MSWPWPQYVHQRFPNLTDSRSPQSLTKSTKPVSDVGDETWLRAAFTFLVLTYYDVPELVVGQLDAEGKHCFKTSKPTQETTWTAWAEQLSNSSSVSLESALNVLGFVQVRISSIPDTDASNAIVLECTDSVRLRYDTRLISEASAQVLFDQVLCLSHHISTSPQSPVALPTFPDNLLSAQKATYDNFEAHPVIDWLACNARERPDSIAHELYTTLSQEPTRVTYKEFNERANRMARFLLDKGITLEDRVCVCRQRDLFFYVAHAAIFKAGGCYVSIDPELPEERKRHIAHDSGSKIVITSPKFADTFESPVIAEDVEDEIASLDGSDVSLAQLDNLAYLLYTSGTTGKPKGCLVMHRGLYWAIDAMCEYPRSVTDPTHDKRLAMASIAFDVHISEIIQVWCLGIRLVSAPRFELLSDLRTHVTNIGITHMAMVPSMIEATLATPDGLPLKYMVSGGEKISDALLEGWAAHPNLILANFYGPTEATIGCTSRQITVDDKKENIGKPFRCCSAFVVNPDTLSILPKGIAGELIVEGPLIARGYHNLPDATKKSFLEWPDKDSRAYRTGDLVRMTPQGTLDILGRIDTQIKLRGVRIESEGVSEVVRKAWPAKLHVHTLIATHPQQAQNQVLVTFFAKDNPSVSADIKRTEMPSVEYECDREMVRVLREAINRELAVYMRPAHLVPVSFLPLTLNGKIDGKRLVEVFCNARLADLGRLAHVQDSGRQQRPLSDDEKRVAEVVADLTGSDLAGFTPSTNLFECGLDSLGFSALTRRLGISNVSQVVSRQTVEHVAQLLAEQPETKTEDRGRWLAEFERAHEQNALACFDKTEIDRVLPLLPIQEGILPQSVLHHDLYVQHFRYRCLDNLDVERLKGAWKKVMDSNDILRAVFVLEPKPLMVLLKQEHCQLPWYEHESPFVEEEQNRISSDINSDLTHPLFRLNFYGSHFVVSTHHALYDGYSFPIIMSQVELAYHGADVSRSLPLESIIEDISPANTQDVSAFWTHMFDGVDLTSRRIQTISEGESVSRETRQLGIGFLDLRETSQRIHVSLESLCVAAFAAAAQAVLEWREDAIFSLLRSGRSSSHVDLESAVGPLVAVFPLRIPLGPKPAVDAIRDVQETITSAIPYEHTPLGAVQRILGVTQLVDTMFSCRLAAEPLKYDAWAYEPLPPPAPEFPFVVEVVLDGSADTVDVTVVTTSERWSALSSAFFDQFEARLKSVIDNPKATLYSPSSTGSATPSSQEEISESGSGHFDPEAYEVTRATLCDLLNIQPDNVSPESSLLSLGLDSLRAIALSRRLESRGLSIPPVTIIQSSTLGRLSSVPVASGGKASGLEDVKELEARLSEELNAPSLALDSLDETLVTPATALQSGMLSQTITSSGALYYHGFTLKLHKSCDVQRLKEAWKTAVETLDILRTSFHFAAESGVWTQVVHSYAPLQWSEQTRPSLGNVARELIDSVVRDNLVRPPISVQHVSCKDEQFLIIALHHALYDGIALPKLFRFVLNIYQNGQVPSTAQFPTISRTIVSVELNATSFWCKHLKGFKPWSLPRISNSTSNDAVRIRHTITTPLKSIEKFCRRYQVSLQSLAQVAWAFTLSKKYERSDVTFGHVVSGRTLAGAEDVIGPVFNTIPCRVNLVPRRNNRDTVRGVHASNNEALSRHHASLRAIHKELGVTSSFDTLFLFQPAVEQSLSDSGVWEIVSQPGGGTTTSQYAINIEVHQDKESWVIHSSCLSSVMDLRALESLLSLFDGVVSSIISRPGEIYPLPVAVDTDSNPVSGSGAAESADRSLTELTDKQRQLLSILSQFTGLPEDALSPSTQLISLGIDSITAMQVSTTAKKRGISLSASDVIRAPTIADLFRLVSTHTASISQAKNAKDVAIKDMELTRLVKALPDKIQPSVVRCLPATAGMEAIFNVWYLSGGSRFQHIFAHRLPPSADVQRLKAAWESLVEHHEILRTTFVPDSGHFRLCTLKPEATLPVEIKEISGDGISAVERERNLMAAAPPSVTQPPTYFKILAGEDGVFTLASLHHFQYDAWTLPMLFQDLESLYRGSGSLHDGNLSRSLSLYMADKESSVTEQRSYWTKLLSDGWSPAYLPPTHSSCKAGRTRILRRDAVHKLSHLNDESKELSVSLQALILASYAKALARKCESSGSTFGLWQTGQTSDAAVPSLNFLPMFVPEAHDSDYHWLAKAIFEDLRKRTGPIVSSSVSDIVDWAGLPKDKPLFNSWINIVRSGTQGGETQERLMTSVKLPNNEPIQASKSSVPPSWQDIPPCQVRDDLWIEVYFNEERDTLSVFAECENQIFTSEELEVFIQDFANILNHSAGEAPPPAMPKKKTRSRFWTRIRQYLNMHN